MTTETAQYLRRNRRDHRHRTCDEENTYLGTDEQRSTGGTVDLTNLRDKLTSTTQQLTKLQQSLRKTANIDDSNVTSNSLRSFETTLKSDQYRIPTLPEASKFYRIGSRTLEDRDIGRVTGTCMDPDKDTHLHIHVHHHGVELNKNGTLQNSQFLLTVPLPTRGKNTGHSNQSNTNEVLHGTGGSLIDTYFEEDKIENLGLDTESAPRRQQSDRTVKSTDPAQRPRVISTKVRRFSSTSSPFSRSRRCSISTASIRGSNTNIALDTIPKVQHHRRQQIDGSHGRVIRAAKPRSRLYSDGLQEQANDINKHRNNTRMSKVEDLTISTIHSESVVPSEDSDPRSSAEASTLTADSYKPVNRTDARSRNIVGGQNRDHLSKSIGILHGRKKSITDVNILSLLNGTPAFSDKRATKKQRKLSKSHRVVNERATLTRMKNKPPYKETPAASRIAVDYAQPDDVFESAPKTDVKRAQGQRKTTMRMSEKDQPKVSSIPKKVPYRITVRRKSSSRGGAIRRKSTAQMKGLKKSVYTRQEQSSSARLNRENVMVKLCDALSTELVSSMSERHREKLMELAAVNKQVRKLQNRKLRLDNQACETREKVVSLIDHLSTMSTKMET